MIRRATGSDYQAIEALSYAIWGDDVEATAKRPPGWNRRRWTVKNHTKSDKPGPTTLVKEVDGGVVAAGSIVFREQEPRNHIYIHVAPEFRGRGISEELFEALDTAHNAGPYWTRQFGDPEMIKVFEALGFRVMNQVTDGWIHPAEPATSAWIDRVLAETRDGLNVIPLGEQGSATPVEVARLFDRADSREHAAETTEPHSDAEVLGFFFGKKFPVLPGTTFCAFLGGQLVGGATLNAAAFGEEDPGSAHLVWVMVDPPDLADADVVIEVLTAHVLDAARRKGLRVQVEGSSLYPRFKACVRSIPGTDLEEGLTVLSNDPAYSGSQNE